MRKNFLALFLSSASLAALAADPTPIDTLNFDADPYFILTEEADTAISHRDWPAAAARLSEAIAIRPDAPTSLLLMTNLASVYAELGHDSLALVTYDRVLDRAPDMFTTRLGRGRQLLAMGRDTEAYHDFSAALAIDSLSADAHYYHGLIALYAGNAGQAERDFNTLARIAPKSFDTAMALGTLYSLTGRERQAIPYLERILEADPAAEFFASLAGCYLALGQLSEAAEVINRGLKSFPRDPELYYYRAWLNRDRYRLDEARADAARAISLGASKARVDELFSRHTQPGK